MSDKIILSDEGYFWLLGNPSKKVHGFFVLYQSGEAKITLSSLLIEKLPKIHDENGKLSDEYLEKMKEITILGFLRKKDLYLKLSGIVIKNLFLRLKSIDEIYSTKIMYFPETFYQKPENKEDLIDENLLNNNIKILRWDISDYNYWLYHPIKLKSDQLTGEISINLRERFEYLWETDLGKITIKIFPVCEDFIPIFLINIKQEAILEIEFKHPKNIQDCNEICVNVERFFLTAVTRSIQIKYPKMILENSLECNFYYFRSDLKNTKRQPHQFVEMFSDLKEKFGNLLCKYISLSKKYEQGYYLFTSILYKDSYSEHKFISMAWGIEIILDRYFENFQLSQDKQEKYDLYKSYLKKIDFDSNEHEVFMEEILRKEFSPSLHNKISFMLKDISPLFNPAPSRSFSYKFADFRNKLSHCGGKRETEEKPYFEEMRKMTSAATLIYAALILKTCDFNQEIINHIIKDSSEFFREKMALDAFHLIKEPKQR